MKAISDLEQEFLTQWERLAPQGSPDLTHQVAFDLKRDWKFDFAVIDKLVAIECHGGGYKRGRHNREYGMTGDFIKGNAATVMGWRVFYATTTMIKDDPAGIIQPILEFLTYPVLTPNAEFWMWLARIRQLARKGDTIQNNGIRVERASGSKHIVHFASKQVVVGGGRTAMTDARRMVLDAILRSPSAAVMPALFSASQKK